MQPRLIKNFFILALVSALDRGDARSGFLTAMFFLPIVYQVFIIKKERKINQCILSK